MYSDALRREEEDTEEPSLSLCPGVEVFKLAGTGSQAICGGAEEPLLQRRCAGSERHMARG